MLNALAELESRLVLVYVGPRVASGEILTGQRASFDKKADVMQALKANTLDAHQALAANDFDKLGSCINKAFGLKKQLTPEISNELIESVHGAVMASGDNRPHLVAIIVPAPEFVERWAKQNGTEPNLAELAERKDFHHVIGRAVERANQSLSVAERVKRFAIAETPFTIENGMMTPTMKPRRHEIVKRWGAAIEALY